MQKRSGRPLVVFSHGKETGPNGAKIESLASVAERCRAMVISIDYRGIDDPDARVAHLLAQELPPHGALILVGSSMGGYVSTVASQTLKPDALFLMAPAFGMAGYGEAFPKTDAKHICIVHGWQDVIVPPEASIEFAKAHPAELHLLQDDHRLSRSLPELRQIFTNFIGFLSPRAQRDAQRPNPARGTYLDPTVLPCIENSALFYPCSGADFKLPIAQFAPWVTDFYFVDKGYFSPNDQDTRHDGLDRSADRWTPCLQVNPDYDLLDIHIDGPIAERPRHGHESEECFIESTWQVTPCQRTETYKHLPTGREIRIHFRRDDGATALNTLTKELNLGVFFYRGDSMGEGGSGVMWLQRRLIHKVLRILKPGGLLVTDGSQHSGMRWTQDQGIAYEYANLWEHKKLVIPRDWSKNPIDHTFQDGTGREFICVGHSGTRYGNTLAWQVNINFEDRLIELDPYEEMLLGRR